MPEKKTEIVASCPNKTIVLYDSKMNFKGYVCNAYTKDDVLKKSKAYLDIICNRKPFPRKKKIEIVKKTLQDFDSFFNRGYLEYRKSVAEAKDYAAIEWTGQGTKIVDLMGREFLDCLGGFGIYNTGIRHPTVTSAVAAQLKRMPLSSQELLDPLRGMLAELLASLAPGDLQESFFISNGTDAVEGALKLARLYTKKPGFVSTINGFHGKSMGALSCMGKPSYRKPFEPLLEDVYFTKFGDANDLAEHLEEYEKSGRDIAAVIVEPIQGEAGAIVPPDDYLPAVRRLCDKYGILFIADEVQTGMGRTGKMFAVEHWDVVPDILCLGKSLGGGVMPLSCFMASKKIWKVLEENPFLHSSTFGGNPLACAAGIAAVNVLLKEKLPERAAVMGDYFMKRLKELQERHSQHFVGVHGKGLLIGMDFHTDLCGYKVAAGLFKRGVLVAGTLISSKTIRIEPALTISKKEIDFACERLEKTLRDIAKKPECKADAGWPGRERR